MTTTITIMLTTPTLSITIIINVVTSCDGVVVVVVVVLVMVVITVVTVVVVVGPTGKTVRLNVPETVFPYGSIAWTYSPYSPYVSIVAFVMRPVSLILKCRVSLIYQLETPDMSEASSW